MGIAASVAGHCYLQLQFAISSGFGRRNSVGLLVVISTTHTWGLPILGRTKFYCPHFGKPYPFPLLTTCGKTPAPVWYILSCCKSCNCLPTNNYIRLKILIQFFNNETPLLNLRFHQWVRHIADTGGLP